MKALKEKSSEFLTISELARILGVSRIAVYKKIKNGEIKAERAGNIYIIPKSSVAEIFGVEISDHWKKVIDKAVHKAVKDYGEVLVKLGNE